MKYLVYVFIILFVACQNEPKSTESSEETTSTEQTENEKSASNKEKEVEVNDEPRVTGIGGIFFKTKEPMKTREWYGENLGLAIDDFGSPFEFRNANDPDKINYLRWSPMMDTAKYFEPSTQPFMVNYRVHDLEGLLEKLRSNNVTILDTLVEYNFGKFIHIEGPEGEKIELWEPVDEALTKIAGPTTK